MSGQPAYLPYSRRIINPVAELKIGPFIGGINTYSDQSAIADNEMVDCVNFDIDLDGSLKSRPPWKLLTSKVTGISTGDSPPSSYQKILYSGTYGGNRFLIVQSNHSGADAVYIYYVDGGSAGTLIEIALGFYSEAFRYTNIIYFVPWVSTSTGTGQSYNLDTGVVSAITGMPSGYSAVVYKDRLWISGRRNIPNNSRLFFSDPGDFSSWPGTNFFDIAPGDGDATQDMIVYQDNLIIFKDGATYVLSFDTSPAAAVLQCVNNDIGVSGPDCILQYENSVFLLKYNQVYEMVNYDFTRVSVKIPFEYDATLPDGFDGQDWIYPIWMRTVGDRLLVRFYNRMYVYHLRLKAWTRWESNDINIQYLGPVMLLDNTNVNSRLGKNTYVATSALLKNYDSAGGGTAGYPGPPVISPNWNAYFKIFQLDDIYDDSSVELGDRLTDPVLIPLSMTTKMFDVGMSHRFKRIMHWGVDTVTGNSITGTIYPFSVAYQNTWDQLINTQWHNLNTWQYPLFTPPTTEQNASPGAGIARRYIRFPKSLRFRLLQFKVDMQTAGNTTDGPGRLYSITAFISEKQVVPEAVN